MRLPAMLSLSLLLAAMTQAAAAESTPAPAPAPAAEAKPENPLAKLPGAPGPHIEKIKALADNSWLDLGAPAPDPKWGKARGRSYTPRMLLLPEHRGIFLTGCGKHGYVKPDGHYMDDVWVYDINGHRWICVYEGADVKNLTLRLDKNGFEVNERGETVPVVPLGHGCLRLTYNSDLKQVFIAPTGTSWWKGGFPRRAEWLDTREKDLLTQNPKHPWIFDLATGAWRRHFAEGPGPAAEGIGIVEYLPTTRKAMMFYQRGWFWDFARNAWERSDGAAVPYNSYNHSACYDSRRDRVWMGATTKESPTKQGPLAKFWYYSVKDGSWNEVKSENTPSCLGGLECTNLTFDEASGVVVLNLYKSGLKEGVYVFDPETSSWTKEPTAPPAHVRKQMNPQFNAAYDPALNVHFYFAAGDSADNGTMLVYRYKNTKK